MKVAILGSGAMGCLYGGLLAESGCDVVLIDVWKEHVDAINRAGLKMEGISSGDAGAGKIVTKNLRAVTDPRDAGEPELVIVFVKATATEQAMRDASCLVGKNTTVMTLQNGFGNVEKICEVIDKSHVIAGTTGHGSTMLGAGSVRHAGKGDTIIGEIDGGDSDRVRRIAEVLQNAGIITHVSNNLMGLIWTKLVVNVGINALTAITGLKNGRLVEIPETEDLMRGAVDEAVAVAKSKGIRFEVDDPFEHTRNIAVKTAANRSSMLQDVTAKRQTEVEVINGAIVNEGKKLGIPTPVNVVLANLMLTRQKTYEEI